MENVLNCKTLKKLMFLFLILFLSIIFLEIPIKAAELDRNVLIINSYYRGYDWTDGECEGIIDTLNSEKNVIKYVEYMDWKRYNSEESLNKLYEYYKYKYSSKKIDLIIATDDAALKFAIKYRKEIFSDAPLIFGGVTKASADVILKDISNVTGIYEATDPKGTITDALKIIPEMKKVYMIHDNSETGIGYGDLVKKAVTSIDGDINLYDLSKYPINEICRRVSNLEKDSIVIFDAYSIDSTGLSLPMNQFANMISKSSSVPVFTTAEALLGEGCIGGSALIAKVHGEDIGNLALRNLKGEDIRKISILDKKSVRSIYDYSIIIKYGLNSVSLPSNSTIINKTSSFYENYKLQIYIVITIFVILLTLISYLIINIKKRIRIEKKLLENNLEINAIYEELMASEESLQENYDELNKKQNELLLSEEKYRLVAEASTDIIWEEECIRNTRKYSYKLFEILGYNNDELETRNDWLSIIHPEDRSIADKKYELCECGEAQIINYDYRVKCKNGEYKWISSSFKTQYGNDGKLIKIYGAYKDITELKNQQIEINNLAFFDAVTKLPNRVALSDTVVKLINSEKEFTMFFVDLDNFKIINDSYGHGIGDKLLILVAERINSMEKNKYNAFRLGGDEFIIVYRGLNNKENIEKIASKILCEISEPYNIDDKYFYISASMGIVLYPQDGKQYNELLKNADTAMYKSKESGKNKYTFFDTAMGKDTVKKMNLHNNLHNAIEKEEFILYYQPIADVNTGNIVGMEALIRWLNPKEGLISPDKFIGAAEESGQIIEIGNWVMKSACNFAKELLHKGYKNFYISVNVSAVQFMQKNFKETLFNIIEEAGIPTECLMIEITESVFMESFGEMTTLFSEIREKGIKIALDDFGCGYSSLTCLKQIPIDVLKIDKSFINDILSTDENKCIIGLIITLMKQLEFKVIAEGVEKKEQLDYISKYNCDLFQGYLISRPITKEQILELLN